MLGEKLKKAIEAAGLDRVEAANYIGVSEGNLYKMFKKDSFEIDYLRKASNLTGQPLSYFLGEDFVKKDSYINKNFTNIDTMNVLSKEPKNHIGQAIKKIASEKNISVQELADLNGITRQGVYDIFKRAYLKPEQLEKVAQTLNVSVQYILSRTEDNLNPSHNEVYPMGDSLLTKIFEEVKSLKEQLSTKDRQIDKLLDLLGTRNFHNVSELPPVPFINKEMKVIYKKENLRIIAKTN